MNPTKPGKDDTKRSMGAAILAVLADRRLWAGALVLFALGFIVYGLRAASKKAEDKQQLEKVQGMVAEAMPKGGVLDIVKMMSKRDPAQEAEMREKQKAIREEAKKLSPESQRELMQGQIKMMTGLTRQVLQMPKSQRNALLDIFIDTMEAGRKRMEERAAKAAANPNSSGDAGQGGGEGQGGDGARRRGPRTEEERDKARRDFFDNMSPEDRATMVEGIRLMNDRRRERGLPPMPAMGARRPPPRQ